MAYAKQTWVPYDENKSEEENIKSGAVGTAERMNHIEDGIKTTDNDFTSHKSDTVSHVTKTDRDKWDAKLQASNVTNYQKKKVTNDDGTALFKAGDTDTILAKIIEIGAGNYTGEGTGKTSDSPNTNNVRLFVNMVVSSAGSVIAIDSQGNLFTRAVSGSVWRGEWQEYVPKTMFDDLSSKVNANSSNFNNNQLKVVLHRGFNNNSPENVAYSFKKAKKQGALIVESDISYTKDNVPVMLHDETINRTARNDDGSEIATPTKILDLTLAQAKTYDFGIAWGTQYKGQRILTLDEFILLCKRLGLNIYLELKESVNGPRCQMILDILNKYDYYNNIVFVGSFYNLNIMKSYAPDVRIGYVTNVTDAALENAAKLRTGKNEVFINTNISTLTDEGAQKVADQGFGLEVWTADTAALVDKALNYNVLGIATNFYDVVGHLIDRDGI
ncbi:glycerophosphodiester phosphodiesterase [Enterococcus wangshanyuanii]|uniref:GP-PDE domain-containing protein n=1 Tax=Enterococcus wangshanyuanii TaxID=2005703 RepID=A0ABQ1NZ71_9ENTE|nr:glycerophosphodiester phosphodiesterase family protein [Enterococcus wangshanyuanii]GGC87763.1 hypothetical protein GCM10011573_16720 [Enterococcus wangshanyuanii]